MDTTRILFIDDDIVLGKVITIALKEVGYDVHFQTSLKAVKAVASEFTPNIIILDLELGQDDGIDIIPALNIITSGTPIILISSHRESHEVIRALDAGAVAYLRKPFDITELIAYIKRYTNNLDYNLIKIGSLCLNTIDQTLEFENKIVKRMTTQEYKLLKLLAININKIVSHEVIAEELWEGNDNEYSRNNYISKLRKYLLVDSKINIISENRNGYRLIIHNNDNK